MRAFWDQGYCATSMAQLVEATKLNPGSIYAAFNSKEGLFLAALDHYGNLSKAKIKQALGESSSPIEGIRNYFRQLAQTTSNPNAERSCFLVNTILELARQNKNVRLRVNTHLEAIEYCFQTALEDAQVAGELSAEKDPAALAAFIMSSIWGLRVLGGTGPSPSRTDAVIQQVLKILD